MAISTAVEQVKNNGISVILGGTKGPPGKRGDYPNEPFDLTFASTVTSSVVDSTHFRLTVTGPFILAAPSNAVDGQRVLFEIKQDGVGSHAMTLASEFETGPISVVLSNTPNAVDFLGAIYNESADKWVVLAFARGYDLS